MTAAGAESRFRPALAWLLPIILWSSQAAAEIRLPQANGGTLVLGAPATRIVSLAPNVAEILYAAGAGDLLVATVEFSDYPAAAAALPRIGDAFRFDLERIMGLRPDLVIGWQSGNPDAALRALEELGLRVWRTEVRAPADLAALLELAGKATGREQAAGASAREVATRLARLRAQNRGKAPVRYFYQVAERPLYTVNGEHLISRGLAVCGAVNAFADLDALAPHVSLEAVLAANPDVLIAPALPGQDDPLEHWRAWPRLNAVQSGRMMLLPADEISRATPRLLDSIEQACIVFDGFRAVSQ
jgi:iron complex transport system substrate-binding protein